MGKSGERETSRHLSDVRCLRNKEGEWVRGATGDAVLAVTYRFFFWLGGSEAWQVPGPEQAVKTPNSGTSGLRRQSRSESHPSSHDSRPARTRAPGSIPDP